jgi:putative methionine-R-sulfoxide reductase with GAF domain
LDIDSPNIGRFDFEDKKGLSRIVEILQTTLYNAGKEDTRGVV